MNIIITGVILTSLLIPQLVSSIQPFSSPDNIGNDTIISAEADDPSIPTRDKEEILWLSRAIYSETKNESEMRLIAWVIRNRVENAYWSDTTYKQVVTRKNQFSGLNSYDAQYAHNISLEYTDTYTIWRKALDVATEIYYADESTRPFDKNVQHFYSPHVVTTPDWADKDKHAFSTHSNTFAFYENVK